MQPDGWNLIRSGIVQFISNPFNYRDDLIIIHHTNFFSDIADVRIDHSRALQAIHTPGKSGNIVSGLDSSPAAHHEIQNKEFSFRKYDLHLSPDHFPERNDALYEILHKCRTLQTDHIVITGDITNLSKQKEFAHARSVLKEIGLLDPEKLTVTIRNHDIFCGLYFAEDVLSFPGMCL